MQRPSHPSVNTPFALCFFILVGTAIFASAPLVCAEEKVAIRLNVMAGDSWSFDRTSDMQMSNKMTSNDQTQTMNSKMRQRRIGKYEVLVVQNGRPTSVRVTFDKNCENSMEMTGQPSQKMPYPFAGQSITVTRGPDGNVQNDFRGDADPMSMAELSQTLEPDTSLYPDKEVAVGEEWAGNNEALARQYQLAGPNDKAGMTLKLLSLKEVKGRRVAEVKVSTAAFKEMEGFTSKVVMQGTTLIDLRTGQTMKADLKGTLSQEGSRSGPGPNGQPMTMKSQGEGTTVISMVSEQLTAGKSAVAVPLNAGGNPPGGNPLGKNSPGENPLARPAPSGFAGKFSDGKLAVNLQESAGKCSGTLTLNDQNYNASGTVKNEVLEGSFDAGGQAFPFTATVNGDTVTFKTGGTTYTLKRQAVNPLDAPRGQLERRPANVLPAAGAQVMRFESYTLKDDPTYIGGEVCKMLIPAGWKVEGGVVWDMANTYFPADSKVRIFNPQGPEAFSGYPALYYYWSWNAWSQQTMPPGTNYSGSIVRKPIDDVFRSIAELVIPKYRRDLADARVIEKEELPKLAEEASKNMLVTPGFRNIVKAGRMRFEYQENGQTVQEDVYAVLSATLNDQSQFMLWNVGQLISIRGPRGKMAELKALHQVVERSSRPNLAWVNKYVQFVEMRHSIAMGEIEQVGIRSKIFSNLNNDVSATIRSNYENAQRSNDRISEARSQTTCGVTAYDAGGGYKVELPSQYNHAWGSPDGQYIVSNDPNYNPNADNNTHSTWTEMQQAR